MLANTLTEKECIDRNLFGDKAKRLDCLDVECRIAESPAKFRIQFLRQRSKYLLAIFSTFILKNLLLNAVSDPPIEHCQGSIDSYCDSRSGLHDQILDILQQWIQK